MQTVSTIKDCREARARLQGSVGFVPTMGALHDGHIALVRAARERYDHVIVSIFVNPLQFSAGEDFDRYPDTLAQDQALLEEYGVSLLFTPNIKALYPDDFSTLITPTALDDMLCGAHRQGHYDGVATVVTVLFNITQPDGAFFGEKDYQQYRLIAKTTQDLQLTYKVHMVPTVREHDGLALSSRNRYLTDEQRLIAPLLHQTLRAVASRADDTNHEKLCEQAAQSLLEAGFERVDYIEIRDAMTLLPSQNSTACRIFAAAHLGNTRLIDNIAIGA